MSRRALALTLSLILARPAFGQATGGPNTPGAPPPVTVAPAPATTNKNQYYPVFGGVTMAATTVAPSQNLARCAPFWAAYAYHTDQAAMFVSTLGTGPLNFALYTDALDATTGRHQPQTLITDPAVTFTVTGAGGVSAALGTATVGVAVPQGLNWVCVNDGVAADAVRFTGVLLTANVFAYLVGSTSVNLAASIGPLTSITVAETAGTTTTNWPSLAGATFADSSTTAVPSIALRVVSVP